MQLPAIQSCEAEDRQDIIDGINAYNLSHVPAMGEMSTPIDLVLKDEEGQVIGGLLGFIGYWKILEIKVLWVDEAWRGHGLGSKLMLHAEEMARSQGAKLSTVDTIDFQAEEFYPKLGYQVFGELENFPEGHRRIFFQKRLGEDA
ncbi:GNAT family N-acetyltransferase [Pontibacter sp. G13]|uniref:GNAT family N-acetyltransferase n=1 Tax=Pontibacter sp. G13 TaxID=3074898 RepID=UPI00288A9348|nr:GNAT family N-acetyltransferase [Pontibacter sp. G13]WNJ18302.1 GNAT family N-acetyltransferase [Pontibacter sp. G13]